MRAVFQRTVVPANTAAAFALPAHRAIVPTVTSDPVVDQIIEFPPNSGRPVARTVDVMTANAGILQVNALGTGGGLFADCRYVVFDCG